MTTVIVACWNALDLSRVCVDRLLRLTCEPFELIVVDNGSTDGTGAWLAGLRRRVGREGKTTRLRRLLVIVNRVNKGYAAAMNQALAACRGDHVAFVNSDVAVAAGWLEGMKEALRQPGAGAVGPCSNPPMAGGSLRPWEARPYYADFAGLDRLASAARLLPGPAFQESKGFLPGFHILTPRAVLGRVGGFDEGFGLGGCEDLDLQWRIARAGLRLGFARRVYVHHVWSGSIAGNGLTPRALFRAPGKRFRRLHPEAEGWNIDDCTYAGFLGPRGRNDMISRHASRPAAVG